MKAESNLSNIFRQLRPTSFQQIPARKLLPQSGPLAYATRRRQPLLQRAPHSALFLLAYQARPNSTATIWSTPFTLTRPQDKQSPPSSTASPPPSIHEQPGSPPPSSTTSSLPPSPPAKPSHPEPAQKPQDAQKHKQQQPPSYELTFTCKPCGHRSTHTISKQGYHKGTVLITCPGCKNRHVISDHLMIFADKGFTIEDLMKRKGELVKRGSISGEGDVEFWDDETMTRRKVKDQ